MTLNKEKILKGLNSCKKIKSDGPLCPNDCPYIDNDVYCIANLCKDVLKLLKEQEPIRPYLDFDGRDVWVCSNCDKILFHPSYTSRDKDKEAFHKYCGYCGRAVKWYD